MPKTYSPQQKLFILERIEKQKEILFGAFSEIITLELKNRTWKQIFDECLAIGIPFPCGKGFAHLRDSFWPQIRIRAVGKKDQQRKTGAGGGLDVQLDELENKVLDIIGRESSAIVGLPVQESWAKAEANREGTSGSSFPAQTVAKSQIRNSFDEQSEKKT